MAVRQAAAIADAPPSRSIPNLQRVRAPISGGGMTRRTVAERVGRAAIRWQPGLADFSRLLAYSAATRQATPLARK